jgi:hypothetical protein
MRSTVSSEILPLPSIRRAPIQFKHESDGKSRQFCRTSRTECIKVLNSSVLGLRSCVSFVRGRAPHAFRSYGRGHIAVSCPGEANGLRAAALSPVSRSMAV